MAKYIDAEKLKAEIERMRKINRKAFEADHIVTDLFHGRTQAINHLFEFITSLQQEQLEVDLEKEYRDWWENEVSGNVNIKHTMEWYLHETARHFYELGKNSK